MIAKIHFLLYRWWCVNFEVALICPFRGNYSRSPKFETEVWNITMYRSFHFGWMKQCIIEQSWSRGWQTFSELSAILIAAQEPREACNRSNSLIIVAEALPGHSASEKDTILLVLSAHSTINETASEPGFLIFPLYFHLVNTFLYSEIRYGALKIWVHEVIVTPSGQAPYTLGFQLVWLLQKTTWETAKRDTV